MNHRRDVEQIRTDTQRQTDNYQLLAGGGCADDLAQRRQGTLQQRALAKEIGAAVASQR